jgi:glycine/D-amino acid oxidase-like deaminating enzyme
MSKLERSKGKCGPEKEPAQAESGTEPAQAESGTEPAHKVFLHSGETFWGLAGGAPYCAQGEERVDTMLALTTKNNLKARLGRRNGQRQWIVPPYPAGEYSLPTKDEVETWAALRRAAHEKTRQPKGGTSHPKGDSESGESEKSPHRKQGMKQSPSEKEEARTNLDRDKTRGLEKGGEQGQPEQKQKDKPQQFLKTPDEDVRRRRLTFFTHLSKMRAKEQAASAQASDERQVAPQQTGSALGKGSETSDLKNQKTKEETTLKANPGEEKTPEVQQSIGLQDRKLDANPGESPRPKSETIPERLSRVLAHDELESSQSNKTCAEVGAQALTMSLKGNIYGPMQLGDQVRNFVADMRDRPHSVSDQDLQSYSTDSPAQEPYHCKWFAQNILGGAGKIPKFLLIAAAAKKLPWLADGQSFWLAKTPLQLNPLQASLAGGLSEFTNSVAIGDKSGLDPWEQRALNGAVGTVSLGSTALFSRVVPLASDAVFSRLSISLGRLSRPGLEPAGVGSTIENAPKIATGSDTVKTALVATGAGDLWQGTIAHLTSLGKNVFNTTAASSLPSLAGAWVNAKVRGAEFRGSQAAEALISNAVQVAALPAAREAISFARTNSRGSLINEQPPGSEERTSVETKRPDGEGSNLAASGVVQTGDSTELSVRPSGHVPENSEVSKAMAMQADKYRNRSSFEARVLPLITPFLVGEHKADLLVVGVGESGMNIAIKAAHAGLRVIAVDAGEIAGGASAKGGSVITSFSEGTLRPLSGTLVADRSALYTDAKQDILARASGLSTFEPRPNFRIVTDPTLADKLLQEHAAMKNPDVSFVQGREAAEITPSAVAAIVENQGGGIVAREFIQEQLLRNRGIEVYSNSPVISLTFSGVGKPVIAHTPGGMVKADQVVFATGGIPEPFVPQLSGLTRPVQSFSVAAHTASARAIPGSIFNAGAKSGQLGDPGVSPYYHRLGAGDPDQILFVGPNRFLNRETAVMPWEHENLWQQLHSAFPDAIAQRTWTAVSPTALDNMPIVTQLKEQPNVKIVVSPGLVASNAAADVLVKEGIIPDKENWQEHNFFRLDRPTLQSDK